MRQPPLEDSPLQTAWPTEPAGPPPSRRHPLSFFKELPVLILIAFGLALLIKTFLVQAFYIPSESMEPTLHGCQPCPDADRVLVNKFALRFREPRRGEIVVFIAEHGEQPKSFLGRIRSFLTSGLGFEAPGGGREKDYIKRVIGLPGEQLWMEDGIVRVQRGNRVLTLKEPYLKEKDLARFPATGKYTVPEGHYFVMGDNRTNSSDSRSRLGPIKREDIIGKAFVRIWPLSRIGLLDVPSYGKSRTVRALAPPGLVLPPLVVAARRARRRRAA